MSEYTHAAYRAAPPMESPRRLHSFEVRLGGVGTIIRFRLADTTEIPVSLTDSDLRDLVVALREHRDRL